MATDFFCQLLIPHLTGFLTEVLFHFKDTQTNTPYTKLSRLFITDEASESRIPNIKTLEYPSDVSQMEAQTPGEDSTGSGQESQSENRRGAAEGYVNVTVSSKRFRSESDPKYPSTTSLEPMEFENIVRFRIQ